jgi:hypothetical protein
VQAGLGIKGDLISKISNAKRASRGAQMAEHLPSPKFKPQYHKKKKKMTVGLGYVTKIILQINRKRSRQNSQNRSIL